MATNQYVNKVVFGSTTLIDISDTTAVASDVASGKYFYTANGARVQGTASGGGGGGIIINDASDSHGGVVRTITAVEISGTKQITQNGTGIDVTEYAAVDVAVPTSGSGALVIEFERNSTTGYWDPNKTFTEIQAAYNNGQDVVLTSPNDSYEVSGSYDDSDECLYYEIIWFDYNESKYFTNYYIFDSNGVVDDGGGELITPPVLKTVEHVQPTESSQTITPGSGYDALSSVQIDAISSTYVGSGITRRSSTDLTASGATVTVPAGYYENAASKSVASGTEGTPTATKGTVSNHAVTVTPSVTNSAGYISGGTHTGTGVSVSASELVSGTLAIDSSGTKDVTNYASASVPAGSVTAPSSISGTSASVSVGTNTLTFTKTVSVTPNVTTAGYISSGTAGNASVSLQASVTTQAAQTIHPSTTDQTIAASRYLSGAQTIKAVTHNLDASKILSGTTVNIGDSSDSDCVASVTGTLTFQTIYSGSSAPSSSTGVNGDIYVQA